MKITLTSPFSPGDADPGNTIMRKPYQYLLTTGGLQGSITNP